MTLNFGLPIVQAPMAGVQDSALALAVSRAGGLGSLPCAMLSIDDIRREMSALAAEPGLAFNVNFFCHTAPVADVGREAAWRSVLAPYYKELAVGPVPTPAPARRPFDAAAAEVVEAFRPQVVSFHFGLPSTDLVARVKAAGAKILASATTVEEARWLESRGADVIIAQGVEAGGHRGHFLSDDLSRQMGTVALVRQVVRAVSVPVIAAGGIADAAGVRAALALGATAAQIGSAYLLCPEATTPPWHRAALANPEPPHTAITNLFSGRPARGIVTRLMRELGAMRDEVPAFPLAGAALAPLRAAAESRGCADFSPLWAGQNVTGCRPIPAGQLTRELAAYGRLYARL